MKCILLYLQECFIYIFFRCIGIPESILMEKSSWQFHPPPQGGSNGSEAVLSINHFLQININHNHILCTVIFLRNYWPSILKQGSHEAVSRVTPPRPLIKIPVPMTLKKTEFRLPHQSSSVEADLIVELENNFNTTGESSLLI